MRISAENTSPYYGGILAHSFINNVYLNGVKQKLVTEFCTKEGWIVTLDQSATQWIKLFGDVTYDWNEDIDKNILEELLVNFLSKTNQES